MFGKFSILMKSSKNMQNSQKHVFDNPNNGGTASCPCPDKTVPDKTVPDKIVLNCKIVPDKTVPDKTVPKSRQNSPRQNSPKFLQILTQRIN